MDEGDIVGGEAPQTADPSVFWSSSARRFSRPRRLEAGPRGAPEDARGIGAGDHRGKLAVVGGEADILGFVHGEQGGGGRADGVGDGAAAKEMDAGLAQPTV